MQATLLPKKTIKLRYIIFYEMLIALGIAVFHLIYFNKAFPASEGWHITYVKLMQEGKMPYRDFYYYLPPLDLFVSDMFWKLSFGSYLTYRAWRLIERILIAELMFILLHKRTRPVIAMMASVAGALMSAASVYDLQGDYNQTIYLLMAVFLSAILWFLRVKRGKKRMAALVVGICLGMVFLGKQPHFVSCFLVLLSAILWYGIRRRDRNTGLYVLCSALGALIPIGLCSAWLLLNHAFIPFLEQVFLNTDSKGNLFDLVFKSLYYLVNDRNMIPVFLAGGLVAAALWYGQRSKIAFLQEKRVQAALGVCGIAVVVWTLYQLRYSYHTAVHSVMEGSFYQGEAIILMLTVIPAAVIVWLNDREDRVGNQKKALLLAGAVLFSVVIFLDTALAVTNYGGLAGIFFESEETFYNLTAIYQRIVSVVILAGLVITGVKSTQRGFKDWETFFLLAVAFAANYGAKMGAGVSMCSPHYYVLAIPIVFIWISEQEGRFQRIRQTSILSAFFLLLLVVSCQKSISSYRWWGWAEAPVYEHTEVLDIPGMEGFQVAPETKTIYEEVTKLVRLNTQEDSHVLGYPHSVIFNQFADRNKLDRFVPIYFYDVCARAFAESDFSYLEDNPPDLIVYQNIPFCYEAHVAAFQNGEELAQYGFEEWFAVNRNRLYELVGQISNFYVYKLKDNGIPVGYTYCEGVNINTTASVYERFSDSALVRKTTKQAECLFTGEGTIGNPYQIAGEKDLYTLAHAVKNGVLFDGVYFEQICDIQMNGEPWEPIGEFDSGAYFCGIYNGAGHYISNIQCRGSLETGHAGLFGDLSGIVVNLGIRDSSFSGRFAGTIASNCYGNGSIINCYAIDCDIEASLAAGGIAAYFYGGDIRNCFTDCQIRVDSRTGELLTKKYKFAGIIQNVEGYGITTSGSGVKNCFSVGYEVFAGNNSFLGLSNNFEIGSSVEARRKAAYLLNSYIRNEGNPHYVFWTLYDGKLLLQ